MALQPEVCSGRCESSKCSTLHVLASSSTRRITPLQTGHSNRSRERAARAPVTSSLRYPPLARWIPRVGLRTQCSGRPLFEIRSRGCVPLPMSRTWPGLPPKTRIDSEEPTDFPAPLADRHPQGSSPSRWFEFQDRSRMLHLVPDGIRIVSNRTRHRPAISDRPTRSQLFPMRGLHPSKKHLPLRSRCRSTASPALRQIDTGHPVRLPPRRFDVLEALLREAFATPGAAFPQPLGRRLLPWVSVLAIRCHLRSNETSLTSKSVTDFRRSHSRRSR